MEEYLRTEEHRGHKINIYQDPEPENPREWDNLGTMVCFHRRYDLGDKHDFSSPEELLEFVGGKDIISLPIYMYEHGNIGISTSNSRYPYNCPWDSGQIGFIYVDKSTIRREYMCSRITKGIVETAYKVLQGEIDAYHKYLSGDVLGYIIEDADGDMVESCWGYYDDDFIEECKSIIDNHIGAENKHFPKVEVFVTKTRKFRARIKESPEEASYEVTVGGEEWAKGKASGCQERILCQMVAIMEALEKEYGTVLGIPFGNPE